jgi:hypothetical protein
MVLPFLGKSVVKKKGLSASELGNLRLAGSVGGVRP